MYLDIFAWLEAENLLIVHNSSKDEFSGAFCVGQSWARFRRRKVFIKKISAATRWTIIHLEISLKVMAAWTDRTFSLVVWLNHSISGTCYFLDGKFREMPRSSISACSGSNYLSSCKHVILKPCCRYSLLTCLIKSSMFFTFLFLIIIPVANIMCWDIMFRNTIPLMCMRSQHRENLFHLSWMTLGTFGTMIGSTCWNLWRTVLPWRYGTLSP